MMGHAVDNVAVGDVLGVPAWDCGKYRLKGTTWGSQDSTTTSMSVKSFTITGSLLQLHQVDRNGVSVRWGMDKTVAGHVRMCMVDKQLGLMGFPLTVWVEWMWWNGSVSECAQWVGGGVLLHVSMAVASTMLQCVNWDFLTRTKQLEEGW